VKTLLDVLRSTETWLRDRGVPGARRDAEQLLAHALDTDRLQLYLRFDQPLTTAELDRLRPLVARRGRREPLAWIVGSRGFYAHDFAVGPGVLVPRPDTETLVDAALALLPEAAPCFVADIGCGSGAVGLSLAAARPELRLYAVDLSEAALDATRQNAAALGLQARVGVLRGDLLDAIPAHRPIDVVVSNPPYIPSAEIDALEPEVSQHEPRLALDGGADGLAVYRRLVPAAARRARRALLVEVGAGQAPAVVALFEAAGLRAIRTHDDLGGHTRVVEGQVPTA
jgi:release factor glutamine methyltransferase